MTIIAYYLDTQGFTGDSTDLNYSNDFIVLSHSFSLQKVGNKPRVSGLTITKPLGKGTAALLSQFAQGLHFPQVFLRGVQSGKKDFEFERIVLSAVTVTSFAEEETSGVPTITMTLAFRQMNYTYIPQLPDGTRGTEQTVQIRL